MWYVMRDHYLSVGLLEISVRVGCKFCVLLKQAIAHAMVEPMRTSSLIVPGEPWIPKLMHLRESCLRVENRETRTGCYVAEVHYTFE